VSSIVLVLLSDDASLSTAAMTGRFHSTLERLLSWLHRGSALVVGQESGRFAFGMGAHNLMSAAVCVHLTRLINLQFVVFAVCLCLATGSLVIMLARSSVIRLHCISSTDALADCHGVYCILFVLLLSTT
jgi:hypothetical protein